MTTNTIEKEVILKAPQSKVWRALSNAEEFGTWFGVKLEGEFAPGAQVQGRITHPGYEHLTMEVKVEKVEPEHLLSYRWHPAAIDPAVDYSNEPTTLVEFRLQKVDGGTRLKVVESGFDRIPLARREEAFRMNEGGWTAQMKNLQEHVEG